jgi:putative acyl-CoA dehydrogenase
VAKLYTAKQAIASASEVLEAFGGAGYIEDTGLPRLLRDAQVLSIWEGTTNVLSLDTLRAIEKEGALEHFVTDIRFRLRTLDREELKPLAVRVQDAISGIESYWHRSGADATNLQAGARALAYSLARTYAASLLLEHADDEFRTTKDRRLLAAAQRWCAQAPAAPIYLDGHHRAVSEWLAMENV